MNYKKPTWLSHELWQSYLNTHLKDGVLHCHICNEPIPTNLHECDHQICRSHWGDRPGNPDDPSNLLPSDHFCNNRRSNGPSKTWSKSIVFDGAVNLENARTSQRVYVHDEIMRYDKAFAVPYGNINSRILAMFQIVGAGKTIGMGLLPYTLNSASLKHYPTGGPRTQRMLIATKDTQLRSQIATELSEELLKFKLVTKAPRVMELSEPKKQIASGEIFHNDIVVCCPQFLWTQDGEKSEYLNTILNEFQLICFDEVHWAYNQILMLLSEVRNRHNLLFGFTASPIKPIS